jgi:hypothetical protein
MEKNCRLQGHGGKIMCDEQKNTQINHLKKTLKNKENH